jgi:hypothetical protein
VLLSSSLLLLFLLLQLSCHSVTAVLNTGTDKTNKNEYK